MKLEQILNDPFIKGRLNPLFLLEIKKYATHPDLRSVILFIFRKILQPIYFEYFSLQKGTVFFLSTISSDGIGDFTALHKAAELFKKHFPNFEAKIGYTYQRTLPKLSSQLETYAFEDPEYIIEKIVEGLQLPDFEAELKSVEEQLTSNVDVYESIKVKSSLAAEALEEYHLDLKNRATALQKNIFLQKSGAKFYQELLSCQAIVNISLALNTFENPLLTKKSLYFSETGNFQGIQYAEKLNWYSMGLLPLEEGIFLSSTETSFAQEKTQYVSYITKISNAKISYIYLICELELQKSCDIEIILFPLTEQEFASLDGIYLQKLGISEIRVDKANSIKISASSGKVLHLIQMLPLPYADFIKLIGQSQKLVGCTGDLSLSEVISLGKLPFYEMREHKTETVESLMNIAWFLKLDTINAYFIQLREVENINPIALAAQLAKLVASPNFENQWQILREFIQQYYCFEKSFIATMKAFFAYQENPNWKQMEEELIFNSMQRKCSIEEVYSDIKNRFAKLILRSGT